MCNLSFIHSASFRISMLSFGNPKFFFFQTFPLMFLVFRFKFMNPTKKKGKIIIFRQQKKKKEQTKNYNRRMNNKNFTQNSNTGFKPTRHTKQQKL